MDRLFERDGISASEAARRALTAWLTEKGVLSDTPATVATKARHAKRVGAAFVKATRTRAAS